MGAVSKKLKFVILQLVYVISLLLLRILAANENYQYSRMKNFTYHRGALYIKAWQTEEKKKIHTDLKDVEKTLIGCPEEYSLFVCSFSAFTFTWYSLKSFSLTSSKPLYQRLNCNFWIPWNFWILAFYKIDKFVIGPFETCLSRCHLVFLKKQQKKKQKNKKKKEIRAFSVSNFHPGLEKMSIIWKTWNFHVWLTFHLRLVKTNWNFKSV